MMKRMPTRPSGSKTASATTELFKAFPNLNNLQQGRVSSKYAPKKSFKNKPKKENVVYKDVILFPSPSTKAVPTHQTRCQLENDGFVVHGFPVEKS